jgi:hypothetical protein
MSRALKMSITVSSDLLTNLNLGKLSALFNFYYTGYGSYSYSS